jgi:Fungal specific transcription factor domain
MDIADCRDLRQLQAMVFMIIFLQSSAKLSVCYAYIGVALRSALRMGLHRCFRDNFNPIVLESRKRAFWVIRKMDTYVGALLGLPHSLEDDQIDQEFPTEVDDEYISEQCIMPMPEGSISIMSAANAHTHLVHILAKIVKHIYPVKASTNSNLHNHNVKSYSVRYSKIFEIEQDLQLWQDRLPSRLKPGGEAPRRILRYVMLNGSATKWLMDIDATTFYAWRMHMRK